MKKIIREHIILFYFVIFTFSILVFATQSADAKEPIQLSICMPDRAPWSYLNEQGKARGIDVEVIQELEKRIGVKVKIEFFPWKRCLNMLKGGKTDLVARYSKTVERQSFSFYVEPPYTKDDIVFFMRADDEDTISSYEELYGKTIGTLRGNVYESKFDKDKNLDKELVDSKEQLFKMLQNGRVNVVAIYEISSLYYLSQHDLLSSFKIASLRLKRDDGDYFAFSKKSAHLSMVADFGQIIDQMVRRGDIQRTIDRYVSQM